MPSPRPGLRAHARRRPPWPTSRAAARLAAAADRRRKLGVALLSFTERRGRARRAQPAALASRGPPAFSRGALLRLPWEVPCVPRSWPRAARLRAVRRRRHAGISGFSPRGGARVLRDGFARRRRQEAAHRHAARAAMRFLVATRAARRRSLARAASAAARCRAIAAASCAARPKVSAQPVVGTRQALEGFGGGGLVPLVSIRMKLFGQLAVALFHQGLIRRRRQLQLTGRGPGRPLAAAGHGCVPLGAALGPQGSRSPLRRVSRTLAGVGASCGRRGSTRA